MRVLFEGSWWVDGPPSGRAVLHGLVETWARLWPQDELLLAVPRSATDTARRDVPGARVVALPGRPQAVAATLGASWLARRHHVDVVLTQNYAPLHRRGVVFLHDVLFQSNPEWFTVAERLYFSPMTLLARRAQVVTSSRTEAARISSRNPRLHPLPVGLGLSQSLVDGPVRRPDWDVPADGFILSVGRLNIRKNLATAVEAATASSAMGPDLPLVVVGESQGRAGTRGPLVDEAIASGTARFVGHVDDAELRWLYQHARLFLFTSLDEGFGLPPLEALANGCPVVASDIPVLRETLGDAAVFTDPRSAADIAAAIDTVLARHPAREQTRRNTVVTAVPTTGAAADLAADAEADAGAPHGRVAVQARVVDAPVATRGTPPGASTWEDVVRRLRAGIEAGVAPC